MSRESVREGERRANDHPSGVGHGALAEQLAEMARSLQAEDDTEKMLDQMVTAAVALIPGVDEASISVVIGRRDMTSQSPTGEMPRQVDAVQAEVGEGPCLDAVFEHQTVRVPDMANEPRWPRFARRAVEAGALSMLAFQLYVERDNLGALNLYSRRPHAFDEESERVGLLFASHAAVAFAEARQQDQMNAGFDTRDLIGQAKGILMERYKISAVSAFAVLVRVSQNSNRKLRDVADELCRTRHLQELEGPQ